MFLICPLMVLHILERWVEHSGLFSCGVECWPEAGAHSLRLGSYSLARVDCCRKSTDPLSKGNEIITSGRRFMAVM